MDVQVEQLAAHGHQSVTQLRALVGRAEGIAELRAKDGRDEFSKASRKRLSALRRSVQEAIAEIDRLCLDGNASLRERARFFGKYF